MANSIFCFVGGDQINCWVQKIRVVCTSIPVSSAKLLFEIINRQDKQYLKETDTTGYAGLDNLQDEIDFMRDKMIKEENPSFKYGNVNKEFDWLGSMVNYYIDSEPSRYGALREYIDEDNESDMFDELIENYIVDEKTYYWVEQSRVSEQEYDEYSDGYHHWYDVVELFDELPVNFNDKDVVSIFNTNKAIAFLDLSYGC